MKMAVSGQSRGHLVWDLIAELLSSASAQRRQVSFPQNTVPVSSCFVVWGISKPEVLYFETFAGLLGWLGCLGFFCFFHELVQLLLKRCNFQDPESQS